MLVTRHPSLVTRRRPAAFTLIELLVVIAIIAILAGLAFPAVQGALESGRRAQARNDVQQIVAAIKAYQAEYGRLPSTIVSQEESSSAWFQSNNQEIINVLIAADGTEALNPRRIVFLEARRTSNEKGGLGPNGTFYDPWGTPYGIKLDLNYDNKLEYYGESYLPNVFNTALAVSFGQNKVQQDPALGTDEGLRVDDIVSYR